MEQDRKTKLEKLIKRIGKITSKILFTNSFELDLLVEHCGEIEPFYNIISLDARSSFENPSFRNLRFLELFPYTQYLYICEHKQGRQNEAKPMTFDGIQNCPNLNELHIVIPVPPILTGIEFCSELTRFEVDVICDGDQPMNITPLSELENLQYVSTCITHGVELGDSEDFECITVETEGLDLSGCKSLKTLYISPTSKDLRFLGSVQLERLNVCRSGIESLEGLDITDLEFIDLRYSRITCVEKLRGASLRHFTSLECMKDIPIDPNVLEEISNSWV